MLENQAVTGNNLSLAGKVAVVTGASRGIGRAIACAMAAEGAAVAINYNGSEARALEVKPAKILSRKCWLFSVKSIFLLTMRASQRTAFS